MVLITVIEWRGSVEDECVLEGVGGEEVVGPDGKDEVDDVRRPDVGHQLLPVLKHSTHKIIDIGT